MKRLIASLFTKFSFKKLSSVKFSFAKLWVLESFTKQILGLVSFLFLLSCSSYVSVSLEEEGSAQGAFDTITCGEPRDLLLDELKLRLLNEKNIPSKEELSLSFKKTWKEKIDLHFKANQKLAQKSQAMNEKVFHLYDQWLESLDLEGVENPKESRLEKVMRISAYDVEDLTNPLVAKKIMKKREIYKQFQAEIKKFELPCSSDSQGEPLDQDQDQGQESDSSSGEGSQDSSGNNSSQSHPSFGKVTFFRKRAKEEKKEWGQYGAHLVMATAYQNCHALFRPALTYGDPPVKGIEVVGRHPNNAGLLREVKRLELVQFTHPYLSIKPSFRPQCFDTFQKPFIYDYGGKPFVNSSDPRFLNLHRNAGSGTHELGIDCSGFVFTALATMGLRFQRNREVKALDVYSWAARSYMNPEQSGLSCFQKINSTQTPFSSGFLIANTGHILMVDSLGLDPLGLRRAQSVSACNQLNSSHFNFTVIQSSNSKNGVGINRYKASDYFSSGNSMTSGLVEYQRAHCRARLTGQTQSYNVSNLALVRHKKEDKACVSTTRVPLNYETCVAHCPQL
jgi:hypothetical protein